MKQVEHIAAQRTLSALVDFSNLINSSLDINFILNNLIFTCFGKFHTARGLVAFLDSRQNLYIKSCKGIDEKNLYNFPEVNVTGYEKDDSFRAFLEKNKLSVRQEIVSSHGLRGVFFLGNKLTGIPFDEEDHDFLRTITNIAATAIENTFTLESLRESNRELDAKVNQLSALFDLSKEFSGILDIPTISKLLVFSIIGQLMVSKFALITCENDGLKIIESKFDESVLRETLTDCNKDSFKKVVGKSEIRKNYNSLYSLDIQLIVPMQIKNETKGLILLGKRINSQEFSNSDIEFISSVGSLAIMAIENADMFEEMLEKQKIEKDLELAKNIQKNLLPGKLPKSEKIQLAAFNETARQVGGDYYEAIRLDDHRILIAIADVSGKGVQAALIMASLQAYLKSLSTQNLTLDEASNRINDLISENTTDGGFITFFWAIADEAEMTLKYVNAGHNPPLLRRGNELIRLKKGGMLLGFMKTMIPYESEKISLQKGDRLLLFTDGITEAMNVQNEEFSDEKLEEFLLNCGNISSEKIVETLIAEVKKFTFGAEQSDDITCMVLGVG